MDSGATVDGRVLRGQRSREAILQAVVDLYRTGDLNPTAAQIARGAGLSERSVFTHFDDLDTLAGAVSAAYEPLFQDLIKAPIVKGDATARVNALVHHRATFWEKVTPVSRAARVKAADNTDVRHSLDRALALLRQQVGTVFAPELCSVTDPDDRETLLEALDTTLGWETWDRLRSARRLDTEQAEAVVARMSRALLAV